MKAADLIMNIANIINFYGNIDVKIENVESDGSKTNIDCVSYDKETNTIILEIV